MRIFFVLRALLIIIAYTQTIKPGSVQNTDARVTVYVYFAYDQERIIIFTLPYNKYSNQQLKQEIAKRYSIPADDKGRLDHIQKQEWSSDATFFYTIN